LHLSQFFESRTKFLLVHDHSLRARLVIAKLSDGAQCKASAR